MKRLFAALLILAGCSSGIVPEPPAGCRCDTKVCLCAHCAAAGADPASRPPCNCKELKKP